jgi:hypothetical protein
VLQSIVLPPNYTFCQFSSTLFPIFTSPSHLPQPITTFTLHTHHSLTSLLYQLYTTLVPCSL